MTISLERRIGNLLPKFFADALVILCSFQTTGAVSTGPFQTFTYGLYHFLIFI